MRTDLTAQMIAALDAPVKRPFILYKGEFFSDTLYHWTGIGTLSWDGHDWFGMGELIGFSRVEEPAENRSVGFSVTLRTDASVIERAVQESLLSRNKPGKLWFGLMDANNTVIPNPVVLRGGFFSKPTISDDGKIAVISFVYEDENHSLLRPKIRRFTDEDQRSRFPNDTGFRYVTQLQEGTVAPNTTAAPTAPIAKDENSGGGSTPENPYANSD